MLAPALLALAPSVDFIEVTAALVDSTGAPCADVELSVSITSGDARSLSGLSRRITTDAKGRATLDVPGPWTGHGRRLLQIRRTDVEDTWLAEQLALDLSFELVEEKWDLGALTLWAPGDPGRWAEVSDNELREEWIRRREMGPWASPANEEVLREIARRGGGLWPQFLAHRLEELEELGEVDRFDTERERLPTFRALRMAIGEPDPLALRVTADEPLVCTFPELPDLSWALENVDLDETLAVSLRMRFGTGPFRRLLATATRQDGMVLEPLPRVIGGRSNGLLSIELEPGDTAEWRAHLADHLPPALPGRYDVSLFYHDHQTLTSPGQLRSVMVATSEPVSVEVRPRVITLARADHARLKDAISRIDIEDRIPLSTDPWLLEAPAVGEAERPEYALIRAGMDAMPALLEALDDPEIEPRLAQWISGLCFNITGQLDPRSMGWFMCLPKVQWMERWEGGMRPVIEPPPIPIRGEPIASPAQRRAYQDRWRALRPGFVLELVD